MATTVRIKGKAYIYQRRRPIPFSEAQWSALTALAPTYGLRSATALVLHLTQAYLVRGLSGPVGAVSYHPYTKRRPIPFTERQWEALTAAAPAHGLGSATALVMHLTMTFLSEHDALDEEKAA